MHICRVEKYDPFRGFSAGQIPSRIIHGAERIAAPLSSLSVSATDGVFYEVSQSMETEFGEILLTSVFGCFIISIGHL